MSTKCIRTKEDLCLYAGDRNKFTVQVLADGDPYDTTGAQVAAQVRRTRTSEPADLTATVTAIDESKGIYTLQFDGEDVRTMLNGAEVWTGVWDMQVLEVGETLPITPLYGDVHAEMDVTRGVVGYVARPAILGPGDPGYKEPVQTLPGDLTPEVEPETLPAELEPQA